MSRKLKLTSNLRALLFSKQNLKELAVGMIYFNFPKDYYVYSETTRTTTECLCDVSSFEFKRLRSNYSSHLKRSRGRMSYLPYYLKKYMKLALFFLRSVARLNAKVTKNVLSTSFIISIRAWCMQSRKVKIYQEN